MAEEDTRFIKLRKSDIASVRSLQESVMHEAAPGLQFRTGQILGSRIARNSRPYKQQYFEMVRRILVDEGWVRDIQFVNDTVLVTGSIEAEKAEKATCHMLRGLLSKVYEGYFGKVTHCAEMECESCGKMRCVFKMSFVEGKRRNGAGSQIAVSHLTTALPPVGGHVPSGGAPPSAQPRSPAQP